MHFPTDRTAHTTAFAGPAVVHWLEWNITQTSNASTVQDQSAMQEDPNLLELSALLPELRPAPPCACCYLNVALLASQVEHSDSTETPTLHLCIIIPAKMHDLKISKK